MNPFKKNTEKFVDQQIYAIYDQVADTFQQPLFAPNHLVLARELEGLFCDPAHSKNFLVTNPEGFHLYKIGEYDKKSGKLQGLPPEHCIGLLQIQSIANQRMAPPPQSTLPLRDVSQ